MERGFECNHLSAELSYVMGLMGREHSLECRDGRFTEEEPLGKTEDLCGSLADRGFAFLHSCHHL